MGKYNLGILGGFRGKVGTVVGTYWRGRAVIKGLPAKSSKPPTVKQLAVRAKFSFVVQFLRIFSAIVTKSFANVAKKNTSSYNAAFTYTLKNAVSPQGLGYKLNYFNVRLSDGNHPDTGYTLGNYITQDTFRMVTAAWIKPDSEEDERSKDKISIAVYNTATGEGVYNYCGVTRWMENIGVVIPSTWRRQDIKVWVFTCDAKEKYFSRSYLIPNLRQLNM